MQENLFREVIQVNSNISLANVREAPGNTKIKAHVAHKTKKGLLKSSVRQTCLG